MTTFMRLVLLLVLGLFLGFLASHAYADDTAVPERILGKPDAPITVEEFVSLTCPHCAAFTTETLPILEKAYIDTGKVRFILRDFPLDGIGLKAAALARCMPADEFYPFINVLYKNQGTWALAPNPESIIIQYAKLGGLGEDRAKACLTDSKMQDAIVAEREAAGKKYKVDSTPTFIVNGGAATIKGAQPPDVFGGTFDKILAEKK
jgi:protein-disulfide isomerase